MKIPLFTFTFTLHLLLALAARATPAGDALRTSAWGYVWPRPNWIGASVAPSNTPGNASFNGYRMTVQSPFYLAFLDGYDTRTLGTWTDYQSDFDALTAEATNDFLTSRFTTYAAFADRTAKLERLECGTNATARWSSTFIDAAMPNTLPAVAGFDWTQDIRAKVYGANNSTTTRWLPCFDAMATNRAPTVPAVYFKRTNRIPRGIFWNEILPAVSVGNEDVREILNHEGTADDPSVRAFDLVLANAYGFDPTNVVAVAPASSRHVLKQIAQSNQAISLFDRTVYVHADNVAYTNTWEGAGKVKFEVDATIGPVTIAIDADGQPTWTDVGSATIATDGTAEKTSELFTTNTPGTYYAPRSRVSAPVVQTAASFSLEGAHLEAVYATDNTDPAFNALMWRLLHAAETDQGFVAFTAGQDPLRPDYAEVTARLYDDETYTTELASATGSVPLGFFASGTYACSGGSVGVSADYAFAVTRTPRLPFGVSNQVEATRFKASSRALVFGSSIRSTAAVGWNTAVHFNALYEHDDDPAIADWGYRAMVFTGQPLFSALSPILVALEDKAGIDAVTNPENYTGLHAAAIDVAVLNFNTNSAALGSATVQNAYVGTGGFPLWDGRGYITQVDEDEYQLVIGEDPVESIVVATSDLRLQVTLPTVGIPRLRDARSVDTRVKMAVEDTWSFPQLTTTPIVQ